MYDSRSVAVAFAGSERFNKEISALKQQYENAKADGNTELMEKLEAEGQERQKQLHKQGFSTAPVGNILEQIKDRLPAIRQKHDVDILVSKWDKDTLTKHPAAKRIDVTMDLIDACDPTEKQKKHAIEIQKHKPIALDKAERITD